MARFTITPWRTQADLLAVREQLYNLDPSETEVRRNAVNRVMAWKLRGNLPHAVESTALLIDAILHHSCAGVSIFSIRAVYSAAFTRFVTGFCDIGRNRERALEPSSMLDIAKQIGMPVHFVELRHEATHEELPAVPRIVKATEEALQWLWSVYWSRLSEPEVERDATSELPQMRSEAKRILRTFRSERLEALRSKKRKNHDAATLATVRACGDLLHGSETRMEAFASVLVEDKLLSPSKRELGSSLEGAYLIWDEVLEGLARENRLLTAVLIKRLLQVIDSQGAVPVEQDAEKEALALWVLHLLTDEDWVSMTTGAEYHILRKDAMMWCCMHFGHWTRYVGRELLEAAKEDFRDEWADVFQAGQLEDQTSDMQVGAGSSLSSDPDLLEDELLERFNRTEDQPWMRAPSRRKVPIGVVAE